MNQTEIKMNIRDARTALRGALDAMKMSNELQAIAHVARAQGILQVVRTQSPREVRAKLFMALTGLADARMLILDSAHEDAPECVQMALDDVDQAMAAA